MRFRIGWPTRLLGALAARAAMAALAVLAAACSGGDDPTVASLSGDERYYVSLGDSYATGAQVTPDNHVENTENGYANQVVDLAADRGYDLELVNFGCGGATSATILESEGCRIPAIDGPSYGGDTQADAAVEFIEAHRGEIGLITVSIGGNDILACRTSEDNVFACAEDAVTEVDDNLGVLVRRLREAAGDDVPIVGLTYPDVFLRLWLEPGEAREIARRSVDLFRSSLNPTLEERYEAVDAVFIDVTEASDGYVPLTETTRIEPYGVVPEAVARVCELTYACEFGDLHATTAGYRLIAELIVEALPRP